MYQANAMFPAAYFTALIDNTGQILAFESTGQRVVGVTLKAYEEAKAQRDKAMEKAESLYDLCVEKGLIKPEPSPDELLKMALKEIEASRKANEQLLDYIKSSNNASESILSDENKNPEHPITKTSKIDSKSMQKSKPGVAQ